MVLPRGDVAADAADLPLMGAAAVDAGGLSDWFTGAPQFGQNLLSFCKGDPQFSQKLAMSISSFVTS